MRLLLVVSLVAVFPPAAFAQQHGRIKGVVRSAAKTPVSGAQVTAVNQVTSTRSTTRTGGDGGFSFKLRTGAYRIMVEAPGSMPFDRENIIIEPGKENAVEVEMKERKEEKKESFIDPTAGEHPTGYAGGNGVDVEGPPMTPPDRREVRDRWRVNFPEYDRYGDKGARGRDIPFRRGRWYNPYDQNLIKGDYPIFGNGIFLILSGVDTTTLELNRTPKPSDVSSARPGSAEFFGQPEALIANHVIQLSFEMFSGDSTFKPRNWAVKISPTFSVPNYVNARENGVINIDPRRGTNRTDTHISFEEAFAEVKLEDVNSNFDFVSVRAGIQPFVSDFRGFIYSDNNLGARLFGGFANNQYQFNVAYFSQLEKDTNSGLNRFDTRHQNVYIANIYRQDFIRKGYTAQVSFLFNDDRPSREFDRNGFQVRPAVIGDARPHSVKVGYIGFNGDGHFGNGTLGRFNITNSYYLALGRDTQNPIAGRPVSIRSQMAALELSYDKDFVRFKTSGFFAQGDKDPTDGRGSGFDSILDDPNFVGGQFSFWNRQGIRLTQTGVALVEPLSLLPSLRSSKTLGQANFVNPGIFILNAGADVEVTQRIKAVFNANFLRFHRTEPLEQVLFQNRIRHGIGQDYSLGVVYRPLLINNIIMNFGVSTLIPGRGFRDIYTDANRNCPPNVRDYCTPDNTVIDPSKPLFSLFAQLRFIF
ncbi:MAG: carboxypeptidase-like regulatory domain-containing protein [Pyrinomonadaceae bacterium]